MSEIEPAGETNDALKQAQDYDPLHVKISVYEGPFDLLLDLIKKNEMDIYNIPIADITRQYLEYLSQMKALNLDIAGEFLVMAATLVYIKSKMLLPNETMEDEEAGLDPREELVRKLLEYQAFKEAAKNLGLMEFERSKVFTRQLSDHYLKDLSPEDVGIDTFSANLYDLLQAFHSVLSQMKKEDFHEVFEEVVTIEEKIELLKQKLSQRNEFPFRELLGEKFTKNELIATFLALLEVVRLKAARVHQVESFGDIVIQKI